MKKPYHNVQCNGQILTLCEMNNAGAGGKVAVVLYHVKELTDTNILDKDLWQRRLEILIFKNITMERFISLQDGIPN